MESMQNNFGGPSPKGGTAKNFAHIFRFRRNSAFSLIEVLTVVSLVGVLSVMTVPAVSSIVVGGHSQQSLIAVSSALEKAREYAVSKNTFAYVGLTAPDAGGNITLGIFGASDGSSGGVDNVARTGEIEVGDVKNAQGRKLVLLDRLTKIEGAKFQDEIPGGNALKDEAVLGGTPSFLTSAAEGKGKTFKYHGAAQGDLSFERVVQFTPEGEARVAAFIPEIVRLVVIPTKGDPASPMADDHAASVIQIAGLTGQVSVYRPGARQ